jgi:hypothetical protein
MQAISYKKNYGKSIRFKVQARFEIPDNTNFKMAAGKAIAITVKLIYHQFHKCKISGKIFLFGQIRMHIHLVQQDGHRYNTFLCFG